MATKKSASKKTTARAALSRGAAKRTTPAKPSAMAARARKAAGSTRPKGAPRRAPPRRDGRPAVFRCGGQSGGGARGALPGAPRPSAVGSRGASARARPGL